MPRKSTNSTAANSISEDDKEMLLEQMKVMLNECQDGKKQLISSAKARIKLAQRQLSKDERQSLVEPQESMIADLARAVRSFEQDDTHDVIDEKLSTIQTTVKKASRRAKNESAKKAAPPSTVKRSRRIQAQSTHQEMAMCTPLIGKTAGSATRNIFITPKINPMTPLNRTVHRQAKPNETLFSLSGSPVSAVLTTKGRQKKKVEPSEYAQLTLGSDVTLNLPLVSDFQHSGLELDEEQLNKLSLLSQGITNMLKERTGSSYSD